MGRTSNRRFLCKFAFKSLTSMNEIQNIYDKNFLTEIRNIVDVARQKAYSVINSAMVEAYWQIGKRIVEQEQQGKDRADYGTQLIKSLSADLTK